MANAVIYMYHKIFQRSEKYIYHLQSMISKYIGNLHLTDHKNLNDHLIEFKEMYCK